MISNKYKPMTNRQLREIVADYANTFSDWTIFGDETAFFRECGPIQQMIWFQKMSYAAYRPTHSITSLLLPEAHIRMLPQILGIRNRETEYHRHENKWHNVLAAMEQEFKPDIRKPLDIAEVLRLCETEARPDATNDLTMIAILYAWLGRDSDALIICEKIQATTLPSLAPIPKAEEKMKIFGRSLSQAIEAGKTHDFLAKMS